MDPKLPEALPTDSQINSTSRRRVLAEATLDDELLPEELRRRDNIISQVNTFARPPIRANTGRNHGGNSHTATTSCQPDGERPTRRGSRAPQRENTRDQVANRHEGASHAIGSFPVPRPHWRRA
jgi:hypothetical protein